MPETSTVAQDSASEPGSSSWMGKGLAAIVLVAGLALGAYWMMGGFGSSGPSVSTVDVETASTSTAVPDAFLPKVPASDPTTKPAPDAPPETPVADPTAEGDPMVEPAPTVSDPPPAEEPHPLEPALAFARRRLKAIDEEIQTYTADIRKRERIGGELGEEQLMIVKIRHQQETDGEVTTPFSVYLGFSSPASVKGREVIWVEGQNKGKLTAHPGGLFDLTSMSLNPTGFLAMQGQRYPIMDIGVRNLVAKMIERGEADLTQSKDDVVVRYADDLEVEGRKCRLIEIVHPQQKPEFDFFKAQIYIDQELGIPTRYAAYSWAEEEGGEPKLEEEYTYTNIKLNVDLTDADFDPKNEAYAFP